MGQAAVRCLPPPLSTLTYIYWEKQGGARMCSGQRPQPGLKPLKGAVFLAALEMPGLAEPPGVCANHGCPPCDDVALCGTTVKPRLFISDLSGLGHPWLVQIHDVLGEHFSGSKNWAAFFWNLEGTN